MEIIRKHTFPNHILGEKHDEEMFQRIPDNSSQADQIQSRIIYWTIFQILKYLLHAMGCNLTSSAVYEGEIAKFLLS